MTVSMRYEWRGTPPLNHWDAMKIMSAWSGDVGPQVRDALKARTPVVTGRMRATERYAATGFADGVRMEFRAYTKYSQWVIGGARAHIIRPVSARALHFFWPKVGYFVLLKEVHHPGNKPNEFPKEVLDSMKDDITKNLKDRIDAALQGRSS
jgi:hypothetical protein